MNTKAHRDKTPPPSTIDNDQEKCKNNFSFDLCQGMASANIPWNTLSDPTWKAFLEKYTEQPIPAESTVRKNYLPKVYEDTIARSEIGNNYVWVSVDETTDKTGRMMANCIVGKMRDSNQTNGKSYLICCKELEATNFETISRFVNKSLLTLWPNGENNEKVLLLVTDAASYMVKAAKHLKIFYPNMKHLTCLAHGLHLVAEEVRKSFPDVDDFVSAVKKIFRKCPARVSIYKEIMQTSLPPTPVITRWGTWITAAIFHADHFFQLKEVEN